MNATAAVMPLTALGAFVAIRWFLRLDGAAKRAAGVLATVAVVGALGWVFYDGLAHRWASEKAQWINENARISLAAVHEVVARRGCASEHLHRELRRHSHGLRMGEDVHEHHAHRVAR